MEQRKQTYNWRLRQARERRNWTQREVADQIDLLDVRNLRRWETGEAFPSLRYRARLCELFAMNAEELGLMPDLDPPFLAKEDQHILKSPRLPSEERALPAALLKPQPVSSREKWNRQQLLKKVYALRIKGPLEQTLREATYLKLDLCECPGLVTAPWGLAAQQLNRSLRPLPPDTDITQIYDEACGELLILGEPGAGKTTLLTELARDLLARAVENEVHPVPVIFNLSSWSLKQPSLENWFVEELNSQYQVPRQVGLVWVEGEHILPLLDGLDEVGSAPRKMCVDAINAYRRQHGLVPLVLCSRKDEYLDLGVQMLLQQAISIQPLTPQHIEDYLAGSNEQLARLQLVLHNDAVLQQLITTPLMLNILTQVYREHVHEAESPEMRRKQILAIYIERMFHHRRTGSRYSLQQSMHWLAYLAREMKLRSQTAFYLEGMQFDWLPTPRLQRLGQGMVIGLWLGLSGGVLVFNLLLLSIVDIFIARFFPGLLFQYDVLFFSILALVLTITLVVGMHKGGEACLKHFLLRLILWLFGKIPWNYSRFLDDAAERLLLRKVEGGYSFIHHSLLDYFAVLNDAPHYVRGTTGDE